jgi:hypothetical protein
VERKDGAVSDLPEPLTPLECDLQDFPFMPLHVARLRDSDLAAEEEPEACWYAVLLWSAAWHQLPAASLPNNDTVLMRLCGLGRDTKTFKKYRAGALRGFVACSDGRLYHPVVAEQALAGWKSKIEQRHRAECARIKKANQRAKENGGEGDTSVPDFASFLSSHFPSSVPFLSPGTAQSVPDDIGSKRQGEGQGQGQGDSKEDVDGGACEAVPVEFPTDLIQLTSEIARIAGVRHIDPGRIIAHQDIVRRWLADGLDPETEIIPAVRQAVADATDRISSIAYFENPVRQARARQEARNHGFKPRSGGRQSAADQHPGGRTGAAADRVFGGLDRG